MAVHRIDELDSEEPSLQASAILVYEITWH